MIYTFRLVSDEADGFMREIQINSGSTFLDLRNAVCDAVGYDKNQMSSFFICEDGWEKGVEITLEDMGADISQEVYLMAETELSDHIEDVGQRLLFVFDYMTDRCFYMELKKCESGKLDAPVVTRSKGEAPAQTVDLDEFEAKIDTTMAAGANFDTGEDFYGSDSYNDDELDLDNMDISDEYR
ncbi:MAG: hypothetical protein HUK13_04885 [Muribaculaceae bacterium]|nr:hypothetical protein [Muribaculaceae bacterium]